MFFCSYFEQLYVGVKMAVSENLTEQDLAIIETIELGKTNQRIIAEEVGLSLGMVNLLIKKLVGKGYIKIKRINKRRIFYYLTPTAIEEKTKKTYQFLKRTVKTLGMIKMKIREKILQKYEDGYTSFNIVHHSDLTDISLIVLLDLQKRLSNIEFFETENIVSGDSICNIVDADTIKCNNCINLVTLLTKHD